MTVFYYLVAIVLANLSVAYFGVGSVYINAFLFIGLDLTARDKLHDQWSGKSLWLKMLVLILAGGTLSYLMNRDALQIALASTAAFIGAGLSDAILYHLLRNKKRMVKINGSNALAALVDSVIFPTIAFGGFMPLVVIGQYAAKVLGGFVWSKIIYARDN